MAVKEQELNNLISKLLLMGSEVEAALKNAVRALLEKDLPLAREVIQNDLRVNVLDIEIEEESIRLIALRQPVAGDLRFITTALKIIADLERMGDLAVNIAERAIELKNEIVELPPFVDIPRMREIAQGMTRDAMDSFVHRDKKLALDVIMRDSKIDDLKHTVLSELMMLMTESPARICWAMKMSFVAQYLERFADHATNIAEMTVYLVEGRIIRHMAKSYEPKSKC